MKVHWLQHVPFEGLGAMEPWLHEHSASLTTTRLFTTDILPEVDSFDMLIVMGGPMGITDEQKYAWLIKEKDFILTAIERGRRVFGICLGAQLIASALGSAVTRNSQPEIGWFPIDKVPGAARSTLANHLPERMTVLHWHGDTFALPAGSIPLYRSAACENQGFVFDERIVGLQFHLETTQQGLRDLVDNCRDELVASPFVQNERELLADANPWRSTNRQMLRLLEWFNA